VVAGSKDIDEKKNEKKKSLISIRNELAVRPPVERALFGAINKIQGSGQTAVGPGNPIKLSW
jgi:hypothetical protein